MARSLNRLSAKQVEKLTKPGRHADGGGLYLSISRDGSRRRWVFLYRERRAGPSATGRLREMGLGGGRDISLADARELAARARAALRDGRDPLAERMAARAIPTFRQMADEVISSLEGGWRNAKHRNQWRTSLDVSCKDLHEVPVDAITTQDVLTVLKPLWTRLPETASRVRGRIEKVLDAAKAKGFRTGENPGRWRGNLDHLLPKRQKLSRGHHKALAYSEVSNFIARLRERPSVAALCLEFTILTAARRGEALGARWDEIDLERGLWTVPAARMKNGRQHRVPLCGRARDILESMKLVGTGEYIFPGLKPGRPLSAMVLQRAVRRMKVEATVHGFRSAFRDWAAEATDVANEVAEMALAHTIPNGVERAYRRGNLLDKRRALMEAWAAFCDPKAGNVVPLARTA
jgi:integrase